jgi:putative ABC transport system ATP-binding protein
VTATGASESDEPVVRLQHVSKTYQGPPRVDAIADVSLAVRPGDHLAIVGPSGSGKSTLLHLMGALERPSAGTIEVAGEPIESLDDRRLAQLRARHIGFVFQHFALLGNLSAHENLATALLYQGVPRARRAALADEALAAVGLAARGDHRPSELSGGEQQRVAIARAVVGRPAMVLADEPTGNLDRSSGRAVLELIGDLHDAGTTIAIITHDGDVAARASRQVELVDGCVRA